jgi:site-specific DNA-cytosine methylase
MATGRHPDIAINHDKEAVALHAANHPTTRHYCADVNEVCPKEAIAEFRRPCGGERKVGLLWASPDCKHHSKARGGKPREKKIRSLAWIVVRWAAQVRPRVIALENVEEFQDWGPLLEEDTFIFDDEIATLAEQADKLVAAEQLSLFDTIDPTEADLQSAIRPAVDAAAELHGQDRDGRRKGRLYKAGQPDPRHKGLIFRLWVGKLEHFGYKVEWRELIAADYAPEQERIAA